MILTTSRKECTIAGLLMIDAESGQLDAVAKQSKVKTHLEL